MKILKIFLMTVVGIVVLAFVVAAFLPRTFQGKGVITIAQPRQAVFDYVRLIRNQEHYGVWYRKDPHMQQQSMGTDGTVGFEYSWDSKKVGEGKQVITGTRPGTGIDTDLFFQGGREPAKSYIRLTALSPSQTRVEWGIMGKMPYPFNIMCLFYDPGKDLQRGMDNLKQILEGQ